MITKVKICGITNYEDAVAAMDMGADLLGFNFYPQSPRYIEPEKAAKIIERLPAFIDVSGVLIAAGASALFGVSLAIIPTIILLVLLAIYDFISVYKTKHMVRLAEGVMDLKLPIMFVLPRRWGYQYRQASGKIEPGQEREAYFMGLGDAVMPTMLAVSANAFLKAPGIWFINYPALGAMIGTLVSYAALMYLVVAAKKPQAGLPFLCSGAIIGFLIGCAVAGVNPFF